MRDIYDGGELSPSATKVWHRSCDCRLFHPVQEAVSVAIQTRAAQDPARPTKIMPIATAYGVPQMPIARPVFQIPSRVTLNVHHSIRSSPIQSGRASELNRAYMSPWRVSRTRRPSAYFHNGSPVKFVCVMFLSPGRMNGFTVGKLSITSSGRLRWSLTTCFAVNPSHWFTLMSL